MVLILYTSKIVEIYISIRFEKININLENMIKGKDE